MDTQKFCNIFPGSRCLSSEFCSKHGCSRHGALNKAFVDSPIGEAFVDKNGNFILANNMYANMLAYTVSEMKGLSYKDVTYKDDLEMDENKAIAVSNGTIKSYDMEKRYVRKDGSTVWVHLYVNGVFDEDDVFQYYVVHAIDIHKEKMQEMLTNFASESGEIGVWVWDVASDILTWNKEMYKIFGVEEGSEVFYRTWRDKLHPEDRERAEKELKSSVENGHDFESYFRIVVDGKIKYIRAKAKKSGVFPNLILSGTNIDITDFKETREELEKHNEELEYFTYAVSHDLKSPLVTLSGFSSLINHSINSKPSNDFSVKEKEMIKDAAIEIQKATQQLASTIDSILHLSRIGRIYMEKTLVSTQEIVEDIIDLNSKKIKDKDVTIHNNNNVNVVVQREIFISIVQNLLTNSLDHAYQDGSLLDISIDFDLITEKEFVITYRDNGKGMTQNQIDNLFNYSNREFAKGFGMMIIKKGVEYHHGEINISSEINGGTEFRITIKQ